MQPNQHRNRIYFYLAKFKTCKLLSSLSIYYLLASDIFGAVVFLSKIFHYSFISLKPIYDLHIPDLILKLNVFIGVISLGTDKIVTSLARLIDLDRTVNLSMIYIGTKLCLNGHLMVFFVFVWIKIKDGCQV